MPTFPRSIPCGTDPIERITAADTQYRTWPLDEGLIVDVGRKGHTWSDVILGIA